MRSPRLMRRRRGSILPVLALLIVGLCGFTALSVEVATIAMVKVQCQNAADTSAMAGARALNGGTNSNLSGSQSISYSAAESNSALGITASNQIGKANFVAAEITYTPGTYHYDNGSQTFYPAYTLQAGENYNLVKTTVQRQIKNAFFAVDAGQNSSSVTPTIVATAVAAHRPRDVAIVLDFSGSMHNETYPWTTEPWFGTYQYQSNNSDPNVPTFGHYSMANNGIVSTYATGSAGATSNLTQSAGGMPPLANSYFATTATASSSVQAFTAQPSSYMTAPAGDIPVTKSDTNSGTNFAITANDIFGTNYTTSYPTSSSVFGPVGFEGGLFGYFGYDFLYWASNNSYGTPPAPSGHNSLGLPGFSGYTTGPGYWGKTFFIWPPDPDRLAIGATSSSSIQTPEPGSPTTPRSGTATETG